MSKRLSEFSRKLQVSFTPNPLKGSAACFLWGPRQVGKSTLVKQQFPSAAYYDLLDTELSAELTVRPKQFREEVLALTEKVVIIDEIQKVPPLIDEVHWLLEHTDKHFVLCGSSARKLRRGGKNLLGGRGTECHLHPLTSAEIPDLNLDKMLNHGGLPVHYLVSDPKPLLRAYVNTYLKEEIIDESVTRNIPAFSRFLHVVALTHGQQLNYANIARECGVSTSTVRNYFSILNDTLLGFELEAWKKSKKRRLVETAKYYLFDIGVAHYLSPEIDRVVPGSDVYGRAFEHFLINEIRAFHAYTGRDTPMTYWRTTSGMEVDLILGDMKVALEFKSGSQFSSRWLKGLRALKQEYVPRRMVIVSQIQKPRRTDDGIELLPWRKFCQALWRGEFHK
jgi:predicted AAA+ superfamily ATPase